MQWRLFYNLAMNVSLITVYTQLTIDRLRGSERLRHDGDDAIRYTLKLESSAKLNV